MKYFDAHNHVQDYGNEALLDAAMAAAAAAGVETMVCCGTSPLDWNQVIAVSLKYKSVIPFFGLHPWYIKEGAPAGWPALAACSRASPPGWARSAWTEGRMPWAL